MKLLLDTHVVLWWLDDQNLMADDAVEAISEPENQVLVSAVVAWEIAIKRGLGKLTAPHNLEAVIASAGFDHLPITLSHALGIEALPGHHRDPFDRLLVAQAMLENCTLVTRDDMVKKYSVDILDA